MPRFKDVLGQIRIADLIKLNANPSGTADVWRLEISLGQGFYERSLQTGNGRDPDRYTPIIVMVVGKHSENALLYKEGWLAMRKLFLRTWHRHANTPNTA